ncbi:MAG: branched-chain amino acid ABC transporter permease [Meiothermus sp.]|nr:branched-chain amino acid ABC transporter permease [Meiothermus sp.]
MLILAFTTIATCVGIRLETHNDWYFIIMVLTLVAAVTLKAPNWFKAVLGGFILLVGMFIFGFANSFYFELAIQIAIYSAMALGLNIVVGQAGLLDLGYAAFFAIGAYTWAIFGSAQANQFIAGGGFPLNGVWIYAFFFIAIITTAITGLLIGLPALRLRGDYLAVVTLGLGEVVRVVANNLNKPVNITNGALGITPVTRPPLGWFSDMLSGFGVPEQLHYQIFFYLLVLIIIALIVVVNINLNNSRYGRAWVAIREDEIAAKAMGVPMLQTKLIAFMTGAAFSGAMGVIFASQRTFVSPESFTLLASVVIMSYVVMGGMGSIQGVILGTTTLIILNLDILKNISGQLNTWRQEGLVISPLFTIVVAVLILLGLWLLRMPIYAKIAIGILAGLILFRLTGYNLATLPSQLEPTKYERLIFGIILVLMMIFRPQGLIPEQRHQIEDQEARLEASSKGGKA